MCLPIGSCFGFGTPRTDDYHARALPPRTPPPEQRPYNVIGNGNGNGVCVRRDPAHLASAVAPAPRGWHGHGHGYAATGAQEKAAAYPYAAGADETWKQQHPAAWNGKAAADGHGARGGAQHNYYSNERAQQAPAHSHRDAAAAMDSYYPAATAASADHERY